MDLGTSKAKEKKNSKFLQFMLLYSSGKKQIIKDENFIYSWQLIMVRKTTAENGIGCV